MSIKNNNFVLPFTSFKSRKLNPRYPSIFILNGVCLLFLNAQP